MNLCSNPVGESLEVVNLAIDGPVRPPTITRFLATNCDINGFFLQVVVRTCTLYQFPICVTWLEKDMRSKAFIRKSLCCLLHASYGANLLQIHLCKPLATRLFAKASYSKEAKSVM